MTFEPTNALEVALDENINFAEDWKEFLEQFTSTERDLARKINEKERGMYPEEQEILNSQKFFTAGDPRTFRSVFRKVFPFGAIAAGANLVVPHGVAVFTMLTRLYGTCITDLIDYRPIPYVSTVGVTDHIQVEVTAANITVTNGLGVGAPNITSGVIVMEYLKN